MSTQRGATAHLHLWDPGESTKRIASSYGAAQWNHDNRKGLQPSADIDPATTRADLIALSVSTFVDPEKLVGLKEIYELHVGRETFHVEIVDGRMWTKSGPAPVRPDLAVTCRLRTFLAVVFGHKRAIDAVESGDLAVTVSAPVKWSSVPST